MTSMLHPHFLQQSMPPLFLHSIFGTAVLATHLFGLFNPLSQKINYVIHLLVFNFLVMIVSVIKVTNNRLGLVVP